MRSIVWLFAACLLVGSLSAQQTSSSKSQSQPKQQAAQPSTAPLANAVAKPEHPPDPKPPGP
jgi:hypothetical protein